MTHFAHIYFDIINLTVKPYETNQPNRGAIGPTTLAKAGHNVWQNGNILGMFYVKPINNAYYDCNLSSIALVADQTMSLHIIQD